MNAPEHFKRIERAVIAEHTVGKGETQAVEVLKSAQARAEGGALCRFEQLFVKPVCEHLGKLGIYLAQDALRIGAFAAEHDRCRSGGVVDLVIIVAVEHALGVQPVVKLRRGAEHRAQSKLGDYPLAQKRVSVAAQE